MTENNVTPINEKPVRLPKTKAVARGIVGFGAARIANSIIKNNVVPKNKLDAIAIVAGSVALGGVTSEATHEWTDKSIDELAAAYDAFKELFTAVKNVKVEVTSN